NRTWQGMTAPRFGGPLPFTDGNHESAFDPMSSYMSALGHNDEAALEFFTAGGDNEHGTRGDDRQDYWIEHRHWSHDNFTGLMSALDAATTGHDNLGSADSARQAANLMSHAVDHLANRSDHDWRSDGEEFNPGD